MNRIGLLSVIVSHARVEDAAHCKNKVGPLDELGYVATTSYLKVLKGPSPNTTDWVKSYIEITAHVQASVKVIYVSLYI